MKVRMIEGFYGIEAMGSDSDYFLEPVAYPMKQSMDDPDSDDGGTLVVEIHNDAQLKAWAEVQFVEHTVFEMEIPEGAIVKEETAQ